VYEDGEFDYRSLPLAEIEHTIAHLDGITFPKNLANARAALEARKAGISPEPAPPLDDATAAKYSYWAQKVLGALAAGYGVLGLAFEQLVIVSRSGFQIIHGNPARIA
jgi:hypothetical protein